jgi:hypothetical protein
MSNSQFFDICGYKKGWKTNFFLPPLLLLLLDPGSGIRDPGPGMDKTNDPGSGINIYGSATLAIKRPMFCQLVGKQCPSACDTLMKEYARVPPWVFLSPSFLQCRWAFV